MLFGDVTNVLAGPVSRGSGIHLTTNTANSGISLREGSVDARYNPPQMLVGLVAGNITNSMGHSLYHSPASLDKPHTANSQIIFGGSRP